MAVPVPDQQSSIAILDRLPGALPKAQIPDGTDLQKGPKAIADNFLHLDASHFTEDAVWRDTYGLTGTMRTFYSGKTIAEAFNDLIKSRGVVSPAEVVAGSSRAINFDQESAWLECRLTFRTTLPETECLAILHLVSAPGGEWKIWVLRTVLEQVAGPGNVDFLEPHSAKANGASGPKNDGGDESTHFQAVIVGGGQCGLSTGGRLQALGVSYVILEKNEQVGDAWRLRYESARLHTIREYAHLPFDRTFGPEYGDYLGKEQLAAGHKKWAAKYNVNIWLSTTLESGTYDDEEKLYTLTVRRNGGVSKITAKHIVFATGAGSQTPVMPEWPGKDQFRGKVIHSVNYSSAEGWKGKRGIVVGTANTGHDVADDMYEAGMSVTMIQRGRTFVLPVEYIEGRYHIMYNLNTPTEISDRFMFSNPVSISRLVSAKTFHAMARAQPERWEALERANFKVDPYGDIQEALNIKLGGHYIDVGTSAKIGKGLIKVKSDSPPVKYTKTGVAFADGTEIEADVVVFATGFVGNLRQHVEGLLGKKVADRAGDSFGINEEGEILGAFRVLQQPGLWYLGGALGHARYYSRFIALSIKADDLGTPLPVYTKHQHKLA